MRLSILLMTALLAGAAPPPGGWPPCPPTATVVSVYDGDTFTLDTGDKIRLRWVNTPEMKPTEPYSHEARELTATWVLGRTVNLEAAPDGRDGYGRIVAGASTDQGSLALALVEAGLGHVFIIPPDPTDLKPLLDAQARAREARRGIWSTESFSSPLHITSFHANGSGDDFANPEGEYFRLCNIGGAPVDLSAYKVETITGAQYPLPKVTVPLGHTVRVMSGRGRDETNPANALAVHIGTDGPIWDDDRDVIKLIGPDGRSVDQRQSKAW